MFQFLAASFRRKWARRNFQQYSHEIKSCELPRIGSVQFANWLNPLVVPRIDLREEVAFFEKLLPKGSMFIDIGANVGHVSLAAALVTGKTGLTLSFDPNPHVYRILQINAGLNKDLTNIHPLNYAIATDNADFFYRSSEASFANGGISQKDLGVHGKYALPEKVRGIVLSQFLSDRYPEWLPKLALIKIDTEGYDRDVIRSIRDVLKKQPTLVISECFCTSNEEQRAEHFQLLADLDYTLYHFEGFCADVVLDRIAKPSDMNRWKHFDFLAVPAGMTPPFDVARS